MAARWVSAAPALVRWAALANPEMLPAHIDDFYLRHGSRFDPLRHFDQLLKPSASTSSTVLITLRITEDRIEDIKFKCMGCGSVAEALGGIPEYKMICSNLTSAAMRGAIADWRSRQG